jgi:glycosyltransferase involved in cell wall biosynthesis
VIYNGLDLSRFSVESGDLTKFGLPANARFVTLVANLRHSVKNIPMFLRAAKSVAEVVPDAHFVIAGEGELESELRSLASRLGLDDRVHFIGRCVDVPALLSGSYVCVLTSVAEGFSNSVLEYLAAGKPVVATNVGGAVEVIVDGESGYLVVSDDDTALAARLVELLSDAEMARRAGEKGREIVGTKFSIEANLIGTTQLYKELIGKFAG